MHFFWLEHHKREFIKFKYSKICNALIRCTEQLPTSMLDLKSAFVFFLYFACCSSNSSGLFISSSLEDELNDSQILSFIEYRCAKGARPLIHFRHSMYPNHHSQTDSSAMRADKKTQYSYYPVDDHSESMSPNKTIHTDG